MTPLKISALSKKYVLVPFTLAVGGVPVDPTNPLLTVQVAFTAALVNPVTGDWNPGSWEQVGDEWAARCLVGPGGDVVLPVGTYDAWVKVTSNPEIPIERAPGRVVIF